MGLPSALVGLVGNGRVGAFSYQEARTAGYSERRIRALVAKSEWIRVRTGVYADPALAAAGLRCDLGDFGLLRAEAAALVSGAAISHRSAARWWGLDHLRRGTERADVTSVPNSRAAPRKDAHVTFHVAALPAEQVRTQAGIAVTSVERTVLDVARTSVLDGLVVADSALSRGHTELRRLEKVVPTMRGWPGITQARRVLARTDARAQNPLESLCHFRWAEAGLPRAELQAWIFDEHGFVGIVDGLLPDPYVAYETDGMLKYQAPNGGREALRREKLRQERLEATLLVVRRFTWDDLWYRPDWCLRRIGEARAEARRRGPPRARIYVGDRRTPAPDPGRLGDADLRQPERLGLVLVHDGLARRAGSASLHTTSSR